MKKSYFILNVFLFSLFIWLFGLPVYCQNFQIEKAIETFHEGIQERNLDKIKPLFSETASWQGFTVYPFVIENYTELFNRYKSIKLEKIKIETHYVENRIASVSNYQFHVNTETGESLEFPVEFVFLWELDNKKWKIIAINPVIFKPIENTIQDELNSIYPFKNEPDNGVKKYTPNFDSHVYQYSYSNWNIANWGAYNILSAGYHPAGGEKRAFLKFDLGDSKPQNIGKAVLRLYHYHTGGSPALELGIYDVKDSWIEGKGLYRPQSLAQSGELCWENQPAYHPEPFATFQPGTGINKWVDVDITDLVLYWLAGMPNNGLMIKGVGDMTGMTESQYGFYSREYEDADKRPQLLLYPANLGEDVLEVDEPDIIKVDPDDHVVSDIDPHEPGNIAIDPKSTGKVDIDPKTTNNPNVSSSAQIPGTILWTHNVEDKWSIHSQTFGGDLGPRMALGLDGTIYYAGAAWGQPTHILAVNKNDGSLKWKSEPLDGNGLKSHVMVGDNGTVYAIGYATLYAFDPNTGATKWTWSPPEKIGNVFTKHPLAHMALKKDGNLVVAAERGGAVYSLDISGNLLWYNLKPQGPAYQFTVGPDGTIYSLNNLYAPDFDGGLYLIARDPNEGTKKWVHKTAGGIGGGNNIAFDGEGHLWASFTEVADNKRRLHKLDTRKGEVLWSSDFISDQHGLYIAPNGFAFQNLAPPGQKSGMHRINLTTGQIQWEAGYFGVIDSKGRRIHNFRDTDNKIKVGAFRADGATDWKAEIPGLDDRTMLISDDGIIYAAIGNNKIVAIQSDAPLAKTGWPRLGFDNKNSFRENGNRPISSSKVEVDADLGNVLWTHSLYDKWSIHSQTFGGDLAPRMAIGLDGSIYYAGAAWGQPTHILAVNKNDGSLKWKSEPLDANGLKSHVMVGDNGTVYAIGYATLYAFDPNTGATKWTWSPPEKIGNVFTKHPLAHMALKKDGNLVVAAERGGAVYSLDISGNLLWYNLKPQGPAYQFTVGPDGTIYSLNNLYAPDFDGGLYLIARDPNEGTKKWVHKTAGGIGGGNNIAFDGEGHLWASFTEVADNKRRLHKLDTRKGEVLWSSDFISDQHGLYIAPNGFAFQNLAPPGQKSGMHRINLTTGQIQWEAGYFGVIDTKGRRIHNFRDTDNKIKVGAFRADGATDWKAEIPGLDDRTMLISDDGIIYAAIGNNKIVAIQSDTPLARTGWPRLGSDNRNTFRVNVSSLQNK